MTILQRKTYPTHCLHVLFSLQSTAAATNTPPPRDNHLNKISRLGNNEETPDKTDGESSYSSFYSSFFKTESGSAEDSGDGKKGNKPQVRVNNRILLHQPQRVLRWTLDFPTQNSMACVSHKVGRFCLELVSVTFSSGFRRFGS